MTDHCIDCRFYRADEGTGGARGACQRRAPVMMRGYFSRREGREIPDRAGWPPVDADMGCGDFRALPETDSAGATAS